MQEPETRLTLEAPGGLVRGRRRLPRRQGRAHHRAQRALLRRPARRRARGRGPRHARRSTPPMAATASSSSTRRRSGFALTPDEARELAETRHAHHPRGERAARLPPPGEPGLGAHLLLPDRRRRSSASDGVPAGASAVVIQPGKLDRSPTGTGCSARMAVLHARGQMAVGDRLRRPLDHRLDASLAASRARRRSAARRRSSPRSPAAPGSPASTSTCSTRTTPGPRAIAFRTPGLVFDPPKVALARATLPPAPDRESRPPS